MTWAKITGFPNYMVSSSGNVKNNVTGKILSPKIRYDGYLEVALTNSSGLKSKKVHRLVAEEFLKKPTGNENYIVGHKNNVRTDNKSSNLVWMSSSDNNKKENRDDKKNSYQNDSSKRTFSSEAYKK